MTELNPAEKAQLDKFIQARNILSDPKQPRTEGMSMLDELPSTLGWVYALTSFGGALAIDHDKKRRLARGHLVLRLASEKMEEAFDGDTNTLAYDYERISALQFKAGDMEGAKATAKKIAVHLRLARKSIDYIDEILQHTS